MNDEFENGFSIFFYAAASIEFTRISIDINFISADVIEVVDLFKI